MSAKSIDADRLAIEAAGASLIDLLSVHWSEIKDAVDDKGMATVNASIKVSFIAQVPKGVVNISFAARIKDAASFSGEQLNLKGVGE